MNLASTGLTPWLRVLLLAGLVCGIGLVSGSSTEVTPDQGVVRPRSGSLSHKDGRWRVVLRYGPWTGSREAGQLLWGAPELETAAKPSRVVTGLQVFFGSTPIRVPYSAFGGLSDVNTVAIRPQASGAQILIEGGDACSGYRAEIDIRKLDVVRSTVRNGEFPDKFYESTQYVSLPAGD